MSDLENAQTTTLQFGDVQETALVTREERRCGRTIGRNMNNRLALFAW